MAAQTSSPTRRSFLAISAAAGALGLATSSAADAFDVPPVQLSAVAGDEAIRPFRVNIPEEALVDLRRRLAATRCPTGRLLPINPRA